MILLACGFCDFSFSDFLLLFLLGLSSFLGGFNCIFVGFVIFCCCCCLFFGIVVFLLCSVVLGITSGPFGEGGTDGGTEGGTAAMVFLGDVSLGFLMTFDMSYLIGADCTGDVVLSAIVVDLLGLMFCEDSCTSSLLSGDCTVDVVLPTGGRSVFVLSTINSDCTVVVVLCTGDGCLLVLSTTDVGFSGLESSVDFCISLSNVSIDCLIIFVPSYRGCSSSECQVQQSNSHGEH